MDIDMGAQCVKALQQGDNEKLMDAVPTLTTLAARTKDEGKANKIANKLCF